MKHLQSATYSLLIAPVATATTTAKTATLDCRGADYAVIAVAFGVELNTNAVPPTVSLTEGDDTNTFVTFNSSFTTVSVDNTAATVATYGIDLVGRKRYLKISIATDGTTNGYLPVGAVAILDPERRSASVGTNQVVG